MSRCRQIVFTICCAPALAAASGPNIQVAIVNNQVVTTHCFMTANNSYALAGATFVGENYDPLYVDQNQRMFNVPLVQDTSGGETSGIPDSGWYGEMLSDGSSPLTGPGVAYGANADLQGNPAESGFRSGSLIAEYLVGALQVWNGNAFVACKTDRLQGIAGPLDDDDSQKCFSDPTVVETGSWGVVSGAIDPDDNAQVEWRLDDAGTEIPDTAPADGIYLMELQVATNERIDGVAVAPSLPFYFLFDKNADPELGGADAYVQDVLLPEPALTWLLAVGFMSINKPQTRRQK